MPGYDQVKYRNPILKEAIVRIDFASPIEQLRQSIPPAIVNAARERFPIVEPQEVIGGNLLVSDVAVRDERVRQTEWHFHGRDREKLLKITAECVLASFKAYTTFEGMRNDFDGILTSLFRQYADLRGGRTGLRYINIFEPSEGDPFEWHEYFNLGLLGNFQHFTNRSAITRLFSITEFRYDDLQVKFQYGAPNPDFPAPIKRPQFVLDMDAYVNALQELPYITNTLDAAHHRVQALFEESITDELRRLMNGIRTERAS